MLKCTQIRVSLAVGWDILLVPRRKNLLKTGGGHFELLLLWEV